MAVVLTVLLAGIGLFLRLAPSMPVVAPPILEAAP